MSIVLVSTPSSLPFAERLAGLLGVPVSPMERRHFPDGESYLRFDVIYDDMIRTGGSLIGAAEAYTKAGAASVYAGTTHLVLPEGTAERLEASPLARVIGTDTHP